MSGHRTGSLRRQRGWAGIVVLLIALLIVGFLAKDALMKYGLAGSTVVHGDAKPAERTQANDGDASREAGDARRAPTPIERARAVEDVVKRGAEQRERALP